MLRRVAGEFQGKKFITFSYQSEDLKAVLEYSQVILDTKTYEPYVRNAKETGGDWWLQWSAKLEQSTHALVVFSDKYRKKLRLDFGPGGKGEDSPLYREATAILRRTLKEGVQYRAIIYDPAVSDETPVHLFRELVTTAAGSESGNPPNLGIKKWKDFLETLRSASGSAPVPAIDRSQNRQEVPASSSSTWEQADELSRQKSSMYSDRYTPLECTEASTTAQALPPVPVASARRRKTVRHVVSDLNMRGA